MQSVRLTKALKVKNQLVSRINILNTRIQADNSYDTRNPSKVDVKTLYAERDAAVDLLVATKVAIQVANSKTGVYKLLEEMSEAKAKLKFLEQLPTREGISQEYRYGDDKVVDITYVAQITKQDVERSSDTLRSLIGRYQDLVDGLNADTFVDLPDEALAL